MSALSRLRRALRTGRVSANPMVRLGVGAATSVHRFGLFCSSAEHRSLTMTRLRSRDALHQTTTLTWMDRYPGVFAACRDHLAGRQDLRILSFGCSTGEEVVTLRQYFPGATIVGAEINRRNLAACRQRRLDDRVSFVRSEPEAIARHGPYDAVFCMAVLQRTPHAVESDGIRSLARIYPFEKFDRQVQQLDRWLKAGGLLVIHHSQYRLVDASIASRYAVLDVGGQEVDRGPKFDRGSRRLEDVPTSRSIFVKQAD